MSLINPDYLPDLPDRGQAPNRTVLSSVESGMTDRQLLREIYASQLRVEVAVTNTIATLKAQLANNPMLSAMGIDLS